MARAGANASSSSERSASLCLAVSALLSFSVQRSQTGARSQTVFPHKQRRFLAELGNNLPFPFTCHASPGTRVVSVHLVAGVMWAALQEQTHTHTDAACSFLRIISQWSLSVWIAKTHFLPSVHSLQEHSKHTSRRRRSLTAHAEKSMVGGVLF